LLIGGVARARRIKLSRRLSLSLSEGVVMADKVSPEEQKKQEHAYMLVGRFMSHWSHLEAAVNDSVGALLKMGTVEATVATANMQMRSKLHIIRTMIDYQCGQTEWGKAALKDIERIGTLADTWRNMVAHVGFVPHKDGVRFLIIRAKGKLQFPNGEKSEADFLAVATEIFALCNRVREITTNLRLSKKNALFGMFGRFETSLEPLEPGSQNYLGRLLLGSQDSPPSTSEESPQTLGEPEEK
jgi:hypothetical protein